MPRSSVIRLLCATLAGYLAWNAPAAARGGDPYDRFFTGATMRVDLYHSGTAGEEHLSLDAIRREGPWPGNPRALIDRLSLGKYYVRVFDLATQELIYSRGFASVYGEWETTAEAAAGTWRTFHESVRFPFPRDQIQMVVLERDVRGAYDEIFSVVIDPGSRFVRREPVASEWKTWSVVENGDPSEKVDIVLLPDGYSKDEMKKFHEDARALAGYLFRVEPFQSRRKDFNLWAVDVVSTDSGIDNPRAGQFYRNALGSTFNSLDTDRYVLTLDNWAVRDAAAAVPYDFTVIVCNTAKYGGGGIYQLYATTAVDNVWAEYLFTHELGHHFASLGDEYFTSSVAYLEEELTYEHADPNITSLPDPGNLKWKDLVEEGTPIPTPWNKEAYEELAEEYRRRRQAMIESGAPESERDQLSLENARQVEELLAQNEYYGRVGAFEGAGYSSTGLYRPSVDCRMLRKGLPPFCPVCARAIERMITFYTR